MAKTLDELELRALLAADSAAPREPSPYMDNARYLTSLDGFNIKRPDVPAHVFRAERDRALAPGAPTGLVPLDLSATLGLPLPGDDAVHPVALRANPGGRHALHRVPGQHGALSRDPRMGHHADRRRARRSPGRRATPSACPAAGRSRHAAAEDAVLWISTNEPQLEFEGLRPPAPGAAPIQPALYPMAEIRRRLLAVYLDPRGAAMAGQVDQPGERGPRVEPHHDAVLHARAELAPARRGAARPPAQRGGGDARPGRRALLFPDRRGSARTGSPTR